MLYYYIMYACLKPERYGQARFVEKVNIHAASANSRSSACKIAFALQMQKSRGVYLTFYTREEKMCPQGAVFLQYSLESVVSSERLLGKR